MSIAEWVCLVFLVLVYAGSGVAEILTWRKSVEQYEKWGYPSWWALFTPCLKVVAGVLLLVPLLRLWGVLLCACVAIAAAATILYHKEKAMYGAALPLSVLTLVCSVILVIS